MFTLYDMDTWPNPHDLIDVHSDIFLVKASSTKVHKSVIKGRVSTFEFNTKVYCAKGFKGDDCQQRI